MRIRHAFSTQLAPEDAMTRASGWLQERGGYREASAERSESAALRRVFERGEARSAWLSGRIENWPTRLELSARGAEGGTSLLDFHYEIRSGFHLVGTVEKLVLEAEVALVRGFVEGEVARSLESAVASLRRPVAVAIAMNSLLAVAVVVVIGLLAGFSPLSVAIVALAVGLLDQVTISAFADVVSEGVRSCPRLGDR